MHGHYSFGRKVFGDTVETNVVTPHVFMDIGRLLNIHRSYSLTTIKAINQQILIAQYAQCEQISKLQNEIAVSNAVLRRILKNQLEDLQHREKQRYYKSLAYNINEAVDIISSEYIQIMRQIVVECPYWESRVEGIHSYIPRVDSK